MEEVEESRESSVIDYSVIELVARLTGCLVNQSSNSASTSSLFNSTVQPLTKCASWITPDHTKLIKTLKKCFYDILLLRRWEWYGIGNRKSSMTPACKCMSFSYSFQCEGRTEAAELLVDAVSSITEGEMFKEPDSILTFLYMLSCVEEKSSGNECNSQVQPVKKGSALFRYTEYPNSLFEKCLVGKKPVELEQASTTLFESLPGTGFTGFLSSDSVTDTSSLFNGLVHSSVRGLNTALGLPNLPTSADDITLLPFKVSTPKLAGQSSSSHDTSEKADSLESRLGLFMRESPAHIREWEGWQIRPSQYLLDGPNSCLPQAVELCLSRYCSLASTSPSELQDSGEIVRAVIKDLDALPVEQLTEFEVKGSVSRLFGEAVQSLLDFFRAQLYKKAGVYTNLHLSIDSHWTVPTIRFLMEIWNNVCDLPKSLELLDVLYLRACEVQGTPYYLLLLSLLTHSMAPYLKFVEQWVFQGWLDPGEEFGLHMDVEALTMRDEQYWTQGYTVAEDGCTPQFLASHAHTILTCGKALNLLRVCKPSHPLCTGMFNYPKLQIHLSLAGIQHSNAQCQQYGGEVQENEQTRYELLKQELLAKEEELRSDVIKARQEARAYAEKLRKLEESYQAHERKKKELFRKELLEQIATNQILRSEKEQEERQLDQERLDYVSQREALATQREADIFEKTKRDMLAHYSELMRQAELKKLRAEWRAKRYDLSTQRFEFFRRARMELETERAALASTTPSPTQSAVKPALPASGESSKEGENTSSRGQQNQPRTMKTWEASIKEPLSLVVETSSLEPIIGHSQETVTFEVNPSSQHPSTAQELIYYQTTDSDTHEYSSATQIRAYPREQESVLKDILYPPESITISKPESVLPQPGCVEENARTIDQHVRIRPQALAHEPQSTAQDIIYCSDGSGDSRSLVQESGHPRLVTTRGHAPPSTAQLKMYPLRHSQQTETVRDVKEPELQLPDIQYEPSVRYKDDFTFLSSAPLHDMLSPVLGPAGQEKGPSEVDESFLSVHPLSALMDQSLALSILTQSTLVNEALLRYFLTECRIVHHFTVLKWFLLLENGEFGHALSTSLCEELASNRSWKVLCSSSFLNPLLSAALEASIHKKCPETQRISFAQKYRPITVNKNAIDALDFLQLKYEVDWPCNIVITSASIDKYNKVLQLLLQMKRASWALKNTFHQLKECRELTDSQTRELQVYRHEYQHFVNVMHGYIANQVFQITWVEFEAELQNEVHSLEDLIRSHHRFVNKAIFRCLLSKKAQPVMKLIHNIFSFIFKFSNQLNSSSGNVQRSYSVMCETHTKFREVSGLLIKVVDKLVQRGYQPHLEDFLLRLDFNRFYKH